MLDYTRRLQSEEHIKPKPLSFRDVLESEGDPLRNHFIRYLSTGKLAVKQEEKKPEVPPEELQRRRLEQLERETFQRAFAAGEKAGLEMAEKKMAAKLRQVEMLVAPLSALAGQIYHEMVLNSEHIMVQTLLRLLKLLFRHELSVNPEGLVVRVRKILTHARGGGALVLHVAPSDAALLERLPEFQGLRFQPDPQISEGSVRMETGFGGVEDNLQHGLERIEEGIQTYLASRMDELKHQPHPEQVPVEELLARVPSSDPVSSDGFDPVTAGSTGGEGNDTAGHDVDGERSFAPQEEGLPPDEGGGWPVDAISASDCPLDMPETEQGLFGGKRPEREVWLPEEAALDAEDASWSGRNKPVIHNFSDAPQAGLEDAWLGTQSLSDAAFFPQQDEEMER